MKVQKIVVVLQHYQVGIEAVLDFIKESALLVFGGALLMEATLMQHGLGTYLIIQNKLIKTNMINLMVSLYLLYKRLIEEKSCNIFLNSLLFVLNTNLLYL